MGDDESGRWLDLSAASVALGIKRDSVRKQAKRGQRRARQDNRGAWQVWVAADELRDSARTSDETARDTGQTSTDALRTMQDEIDYLRGQLEDIRAEAREERERHREQVERLTATIERLAGDARRTWLDRLLDRWHRPSG